ncbi:PREDICTED: mpv17-like protein 2 [Priapulus caudatus]|uniref:Mpv17-like protein 2 n=1 Tax=Priapulus caudatus TaxID=37621 RepID=A0ABM1EZT8_PRICU|nr:PREDICTED: mpv17-like protein 2 [Priapulus caudatus]
MNALRHVTRNLRKYPIVANSVTYGGLYMASDLTQQTLRHYYVTGRGDEHRLQVDWRSVGNFGATGTFLLGPIVFLWYRMLDHWMPGKALRILIPKVVVDQGVLAPCTLALFFAALGTLEGKSVADVKKEIKQKYLTTYLVSWLFWAPAQLLNFYLLPPHFRTVYVGSVALIWTTFLSFVKHADGTKLSDAEGESG